MFNAKYEKARDSANPFKLARNSEAVPSDKFQIVDDEFESEERSPIKSNVDLKSIVKRWTETKSIDRRYGRASTAVTKEDTQYVQTTPQKIDIARRFLSRGGFSAAKSKYINDHKDDSFDDDWKNAKEITTQPHHKYKVKKDESDSEEEFDGKAPTVYVRQSGFGKTSKNMNYGAKLASEKPISQAAKYSDAMSYKARPSEEALKYYSRTKDVNRPSIVNTKNHYTSEKVFREMNFKDNERIPIRTITNEELKLFKEFSTPGMRRTHTTVIKD
mmetsp:Transcript_17202/g.19900  ORF Transcript_17202/g.19900 Transcript_17202/m.19900 type:complete len:273 (-) Transcript_17202:147-965(-)